MSHWPLTTVYGKMKHFNVQQLQLTNKELTIEIRDLKSFSHRKKNHLNIILITVDGLARG